MSDNIFVVWYKTEDDKFKVFFNETQEIKVLDNLINLNNLAVKLKEIKII